jgi:hypothetical protein
MTNSEPLCVEFCNFVKCHMFVYYLTFFNLIQLFSIGMIILNVQYNFMVSFMEGILNISDTYMLAKNTGGYV